MTEGHRALPAVREFKPDLILLDVVMPDINGAEICAEISSRGDLKDIPIVFLTAIVTEAEASLQKGIILDRPTLAKPITTEKLSAFIKEILK